LSQQNQEIILRLPHLRGDESVLKETEQIFKNSNSMVSLAIQEVKEVYEYLKMYGFERYTIIDLGIIRNFDYYTGIVFEGYTGYMGAPICGGGRYDCLCKKFGRDIPSTGAAIGLEKLGRVLSQENKSIKKSLDKRKYLISFQVDLIKTAFRLAEELRKTNYIVEMELETGRSQEQISRYAIDKKIRYLIDIQSSDIKQIIRYDLETNQKEKVNYGEGQG